MVAVVRDTRGQRINMLYSVLTTTLLNPCRNPKASDVSTVCVMITLVAITSLAACRIASYGKRRLAVASRDALNIRTLSAAIVPYASAVAFKVGVNGAMHVD